MGIIQRQGIKYSLVNYLGAGIGMLSTLFVYKLAAEEYGLIQFIKSAAALFIPLANLGIQNLTVKYFPVFKSADHKHHGFLSFLFMASAVVFFIFAGSVFIFWDFIYGYFQQREGASALGIAYLWYFVPLTYLLILVNILTNYISNFQRIVIPSVLHELFLKIVLPALILLFAYDFLSLKWIVRIFILAYLAIVFFLLLYTRHLGELHFQQPNSKIWQHFKSMADFAGFSMLGSLGGVLALQLDTVMIGSLDNWYHTGVYSMAITITMVITIPQRSILNITAPIIADRWKVKDTQHIRKLYRQTSLLLLIVGLFLLAEISINFADLCAFISNEVLMDAYVPILILSLGRIVDMGTSINGHIIQYSDHYRVNVYFIVFLGVINIGLNLLLIPSFGMAGAATATAFSIISYNFLRTVYVQYRFAMQPFSWNTLRLLLVTALTIGIGWILPPTASPLLNLLYRGMVVAAIFLGLTYRWRISTEFNDTIQGLWHRIRMFFSP